MLYTVCATRLYLRELLMPQLPSPTGCGEWQPTTDLALLLQLLQQQTGSNLALTGEGVPSMSSSLFWKQHNVKHDSGAPLTTPLSSGSSESAAFGSSQSLHHGANRAARRIAAGLRWGKSAAVEEGPCNAQSTTDAAAVASRSPASFKQSSLSVEGTQCGQSHNPLSAIVPSHRTRIAAVA
jgi:hypothetical protein